MSDASPRFRQDLTVSPTEADGVACVDVSDPRTGANFRLYDFEYQLALQLNGQPVAQVTDWASKTYGADLTSDGINEFASRLRDLGFLELEAAPMATPASDDASDSAADEWMSAQGAKTATFVPDAAMLDSAPEPTPVAPLNLADLDAAPRPVPMAPTAPAVDSAPMPIVPEATGPGGVAELPSDALISEPVSAPVSAAPAAPVPASASRPAPGPRSSWAVDLDGALQSSDSPSTVKPSALKGDLELPAIPLGAAAPPAGVSERRQPPAPESVVMSGFSDDVRRAKKPAAGSGKTIAIVVVVLLAAAGAVAYWVTSHRQAPAAPQALHVRVMSPAPAAVYRWFSGRGQVTDYETTPVAFANPGRLAELLPAGTEVAAGDVVGKLQGASGIETLLAHDRSRVGFYRQVRDSMRDAGNTAELRLAEAHLAEKQKLVEMAVVGLSKYTVVASEPGEVVETLAKIGTPVAPGAPVARIKGRLLHGAFELDADERATLAKLDFCRIEVVGLGPRAANDTPRGEAPTTAADSSPADAQIGPRVFDCKPPAEGAGQRKEDKKVEIPLPGDVGLVSGQPLRLARRRYDAVFPVPASALVTDGDRKSVWIASRQGTAELREVTVADLANDALVSEGLQVGDRVIVDPPAELRAGARIVATP